MHLGYNFFTADRSLQGVDNVVVRVVLIIVQQTVVHTVFCPVGFEKGVINVVRVFQKLIHLCEILQIVQWLELSWQF